MLANISFCVLASLLLASANGQNCIPKSVTDVSLTFTGRLSWSINEAETCNITHFMVAMSEPDEDARFNFKSFTTTLNVDFLMACETWYFNIIPYVDETRGAGHTYVTKIPVPMDADLSLRHVTVDQEDDGIDINWDLNNVQFGNCSLRYRITVTSDENDIIHDTYTTSRFLKLSNLSPCGNYEFGIRVINYAPPIMEGPLRSVEFEYPGQIQTPPVLQSVSLGATDVNLTYALEPLEKNRCPIREFHVNGGAYFNISLPVLDIDERVPVEVQITNLMPNSMYLLRTSVQNSAGWSNSSIVAVQTLELQPSKEKKIIG